LIVPARFALGVAAACWLAACASLAGRVAFLDIPLAVSPLALGTHRLEQRLIIRWPGGERVMEGVLSIEEGHLSVALLAFGIRLTTLDYDGITLHETPGVPHAPSGTRILNDLLMMAAPADLLRLALPTDVTVTDSPARQDGTSATTAWRREIRTGAAQPLIAIEYENASPWQGSVRLYNSPLGYELILASHEF
jgi:hypothetical protein